MRISPEGLRLLARYSWPGNVRELDNIISRAVLKVSQKSSADVPLQIRPEHLAGDIGAAMFVQPAEETFAQAPPAGKISLRDEVKLFQIARIQSALAHNDGNWAAAARDLDMNRSNLHNLATRLGLRDKG